MSICQNYAKNNFMPKSRSNEYMPILRLHEYIPKLCLNEYKAAYLLLLLFQTMGV